MFRLSSTFFLLTAAFAAIITTTTTVEAAYVATYKAKGVAAGASASVGGDDCSYGYVSIDGSSSALKEKTTKGKPSTSYNTFTYAYYSVYNYCTGEDQYGYAEVYPSTFVGDKDGATASATIASLTKCSYKEVMEGGDWEYTCEQSPVDLTIEATWTATGNTIKDRSTYSYNSKWSSSKYRYSGTSRETTTATMQVTQDGATLDLDPNSVGGYLYTSVSGSMQIDRYKY